MNFQIALRLLGIGWNFMYIGGTTLLTEAYRPAERNKTQALNDFLVFGTVALASLSSGKLLFQWGWDTVPAAAVPFILMAALAAGWLMRSEEHTSELQSLMRISYAVFCLKKKKYQYKYTVY